MRNLPVVIGIAACGAFAAELPICEEFAGEKHIQCVATESAAVIISTFEGARQYEFYMADGKKGYVYLDGGVIANTGKRRLEVAVVPAADGDEYVREVFNAVMDDIGWKAE
jgi:hypothetical protein